MFAASVPGAVPPSFHAAEAGVPVAAAFSEVVLADVVLSIPVFAAAASVVVVSVLGVAEGFSDVARFGADFLAGARFAVVVLGWVDFAAVFLAVVDLVVFRAGVLPVDLRAAGLRGSDSDTSCSPMGLLRGKCESVHWPMIVAQSGAEFLAVTVNSSRVFCASGTKLEGVG
ncbi:hypothetical protein [Nocardia miyunensis]|uniref:hypothetical protein n=1 Tax=Nocardia miyunensis TaxID=282684 RepID=UPI0012F500CB|nr:hypothetical protein [Nocardia miyunensis]